MKKRTLKKEVKVIFIVGILAVLTINFISNFSKITKDDLGNTCRGGMIKICNRG